MLETSCCLIASLSVLFPHDPLAEIRRTVLKLDAIGFATCQKPHWVSIHESYLFQIHNYVVTFCFEEPLQLRNVFRLDSTTQAKDYKFPMSKSFYLQHRFTKSRLSIRTSTSSSVAVTREESCPLHRPAPFPQPA